MLSSISFEKNQISYEEGKDAGDGYICYGLSTAPKKTVLIEEQTVKPTKSVCFKF